MYPQKFVEKQKEALLAERSRLLAEIEDISKYPDQNSLGEDRIQEQIDFENNVTIEEKLNFLLGKVNQALKTIENGKYGSCKKCKDMIESGRLEIIPYADLCVTCAKNKN